MSASGKTISCTVREDGSISLYNRDGLRTELIRIGEDRYRLESEIDSVGMTFDTDDSILAVDPAGGPYMSLGDTVDGRVIEDITYSKEEKGFIVCLMTRK